MTFAPSEVWSHPLDPATAKAFSDELQSSEKGLFIGRLGGSDFEAVSQRYSKLKHWARAPVAILGKSLNIDNRAPYSSPLTKQHLKLVRNLNGYFDTKNDPLEYTRYLEAMNRAYLQTNSFTYCSKNLLDAVDGSESRHPFFDYLSSVSHGKKLFTYSFIEWVEPFVKSMHTWATGKKVLIVSPFSNSVAHQWERRDNLLTRVAFPRSEERRVGKEC